MSSGGESPPPDPDLEIVAEFVDAPPGRQVPDGGGGEVLGAGGRGNRGLRALPWHRWTSRVGRRWTSWAGRHRPAVRVMSGVTVTVVLIAVGIAVVQAVRGPDLPSVAAAGPVPSDSDQSPLVTFWSTGPTGRASTPVTVTLRARLTLRTRPGDTVQVLGPAGPGILRTTGESSTVAPDGNVSPVLSAELDCERVPIPVPENAYGLQVKVRDASRRSSVGVVPAGAAGRWFGRLVGNACASWLARQHLTVTAAAARTAPLQDWSELDLTISNTGHQPARLLHYTTPDGLQLRVVGEVAGGAPPGSDPTGSDITQVPLPAQRETHLHLRLTTQACDQIAWLIDNGGANSSDPLSTGELLGLSASVGPPSPDPTEADPTESDPTESESTLAIGGYGYGDGFDSAGIVIVPQAVAPIRAAVSQLCAGLGGIVALVDAVHVDHARRLITMDLLIDLPPGRVRTATLAPAPPDYGGAFVPAWTTRTGLVPDHSGQIKTSLTYRPPPGTTCPHLDAWTPVIVVTVQVPVPGGVRTLHFPSTTFPPPSEENLADLCR